METPGGNLIGAASEVELVISGGPAALEINLGGSSGGPGIVRIYDAKSGTVRVARRLSGESSLRLDAGAGPQICGETYSHPGDIAIAISGRKVGDSLRIGFAPVTRGGTIVEICGGESTVFRADLAAAILAPWGRQPAVPSAKAGAFFQYRADNAASRAILTIDDAVTAQTP